MAIRDNEIDWIKELVEKFGSDVRIKALKKENFFGHLQVNFRNGNIQSINKLESIIRLASDK